jgi:hypothetical protein
MLEYMFVSMFLFFILTDIIVRNVFLKFCINNNSISNKKQYNIALLSGEKITACVHNAITLYFATRVIYDNAFWTDTHSRIHHVSESSYMVGYVSGGYFLFELVINIIRFKTSEKIYILHAIMGIVPFCFNTCNEIGHFHNAMFIMFEISNPLVHSRWFLKNYTHFNFFNKNYPSTIKVIKYVNEALLMITFFCVRILWGLYCTYLTVYDLAYAHHHGDNITFNLTNIVIYMLPIILSNALNIYWFHLMVLKLNALVRIKTQRQMS